MALSQKDIKIRKGQAWGAFWKMKQIWKANNISIHTKNRLFKSACLSILLYGCETWIITPEQKRELDSFVTSCYRIMLNIKRQEHVTNNELYARIKERPLSLTIIKR